VIALVTVVVLAALVGALVVVAVVVILGVVRLCRGSGRRHGRAWRLDLGIDEERPAVGVDHVDEFLSDGVDRRGGRSDGGEDRVLFVSSTFFDDLFRTYQVQ
jgi:hypothetical protein